MANDEHEAIKKYVVELRRTFHRIPEPSMKEEKTSLRIRRELDDLKLPYETAGDYGVVAVIEGGKPGKKIALRADIDALPVREESDAEYRSEHDGFMHACGHDGHIAVLLAAAKALSEKGRRFPGTVYLCFQQGEEIAKGHEAIIDCLAAKGPISLMLGLHLWADLPAGTISIRPGAVMAGAGGFRIMITGKGGHGSRPDQTLDPIMAGVSLVDCVAKMKEREISPLDPSVVSFCTFHGGAAGNSIPEEAVLSGTTRYMKAETLEKINSVLRRGCEATALLTGCKIDLERFPPIPPVINDEAAAASVLPAAKSVFGEKNVSASDPIMGSDNFGFFLERFPGVYAFAGIRNEAKGIVHPQHSRKFDLDEEVLPLCTAFYIETIERFFEGGN